MVSEKAKILVVDDDFYLMEGIRDILELAGYDVITANSGQTGLNILQTDKTLPDLIVSDIMMPYMDGYEFLNAVRAEPAWVDIPFIFLTARGERADKNLGRELGADDYVTKPFVPDDLLVAVSGKLRRHRQLQQKHTEQVSKLKQSIMTILYHEFQTPLTYVVAYNDMLQQDVDGVTTDALRSYLAGIDAGATRIRRLIEDFILLMELETGEAEESYALHRIPIHDYNALILPLIEEYRPQVATKLQTLQIEVDPDAMPINGYSQYLLQALRCLLDNAVKFGEDGNQVRLHVRRYEDDPMYMCFEISDTGRGIPEGMLPHIFDPFFQVNREYYEDQGSGTGLAIVKRIVELHGGHVQVETVVGEGSSFYVVLPINEK
jgi:signal transduction histidine kinase